MRNNRKKLCAKILFFIILISILLTGTKVLAANQSNIKDLITKQEYSKEYQEWLELTDDEKEGRLEPRRFDVQYEKKYSTYLKGINNKIKVLELLKSSSSGRYNLRDYIANSVKIKNQAQTNMCWAFASTAALESHLALKDYKNGITGLEYDFSERHMAYSTASKSLLNSTNNLYAFNSAVSDGGNFYMSEQYLTSGNGAILEQDMPFVDTEESIDMSTIQIENAVTTLLDTTIFATDSQTTKTELIAQMKSYITNYGGIYAGIHGAQIMSDYYNNATGAIYCNNSTSAPINHAVLIIGWDDNFNKDKDTLGNKFNSNCLPESDGAWIIKNSWGESISESLSEFKTALWNQYSSVLQSNYGFNSAEDITNEFIWQLLIEEYGEDYVNATMSIDAENDALVTKIGDNGYMYVSYDDVNIYSSLWGIENAKAEVDYDKIYQHDHLGGMGYGIMYPAGINQPIYISNVFSRNSSDEEELTKISIYTTQEYTCKVKVNPNGSELTGNLEEAVLAKGNQENTINIKPGYHTIEFAEPIELTGNSFAVALEMTNSFYYKEIALEHQAAGTPWQNAVFNEGESFISVDGTEWIDMMELAEDDLEGNVTIKAFTNAPSSTVEPEPEPDPQPVVLQEIQVTNPPRKITYYVGENFEPAAMTVKAIYSDTSEKDVTADIEIIGGTDLQLEQDSVTISYTEGEITKTTTQGIIVQEEIEETVEISKIEVTTKPQKTEYIKDVETLNLAGGTITVTYTDDSTQVVDMTNEDVTATGFDNTKLGKNTITVTYGGKTTTFDVTIIEQPVEEPKEPKLSNFDDSNAVISNLETSSTLLDGYYIMTVDVNGISNRDDETTYKYYWYLSGTQGDDDIKAEYWTEVSSNDIIKQSDGTYSLKITIDSRTLPNKAELMNSDNLYLYVKENATLNNAEKNQIVTKNIEIDMDVEEDTSDKVDDNVNKEDDTTADGTIPNAGASIKIILTVIAVISLAIFCYIRFKNIDIF